MSSEQITAFGAEIFSSSRKSKSIDENGIFDQPKKDR